MAGTMMKTSRRVKRTVREMPRRLTIRLSKGSNRNMVEDPARQCLLSHTQTQPSGGPFQQHQPRKRSQTPKSTKLHPKVHIIQLPAQKARRQNDKREEPRKAAPKRQLSPEQMAFAVNTAGVFS